MSFCKTSYFLDSEELFHFNLLSQNAFSWHQEMGALNLPLDRSTSQRQHPQQDQEQDSDLFYQGDRGTALRCCSQFINCSYRWFFSHHQQTQDNPTTQMNNPISQHTAIDCVWLNQVSVCFLCEVYPELQCRTLAVEENVWVNLAQVKLPAASRILW